MPWCTQAPRCRSPASSRPARWRWWSGTATRPGWCPGPPGRRQHPGRTHPWPRAVAALRAGVGLGGQLRGGGQGGLVPDGARPAGNQPDRPGRRPGRGRIGGPRGGWSVRAGGPGRGRAAGRRAVLRRPAPPGRRVGPGHRGRRRSLRAGGRRGRGSVRARRGRDKPGRAAPHRTVGGDRAVHRGRPGDSACWPWPPCCPAGSATATCSDLQQLADSVAPALERARLAGLERARRARIDVLAEASELLASPLDAERILALAGQVAVPRLAEWCAVLAAGPDAELRVLTAQHADRAGGCAALAAGAATASARGRVQAAGRRTATARGPALAAGWGRARRRRRGRAARRRRPAGGARRARPSWPPAARGVSRWPPRAA